MDTTLKSDGAIPTVTNAQDPQWPEVSRVLIYRMGSLGDTVVALPSLHLAARAFPNADRRLLTNFPVSSKAAPAAAILADSGLVHGYFHYVARTRSHMELLSLWWNILRWRPQVLVYLGPARGVAAAKRDAWIFRFCGIPRLVGVPLTQDMQQHRLEPQHGWLESEAGRMARNIAEIGDARLEAHESWDLRLTAAEKAKATEVLETAGARPILAVSVGTKMQSKDWGSENWRALLKVLGHEFPHYALAMTGAKEERETSSFAAEGWLEAAGAEGLVINLCGLLTPRESAACFGRARAFLGHDSGPMHLAAAANTPCVAIFSARNIPRVWFPVGKRHRVIYHDVSCKGCYLETCTVEKKRCLTSITVDEVAEQVRAVLAEQDDLFPMASEPEREFTSYPVA